MTAAGRRHRAQGLRSLLDLKDRRVEAWRERAVAEEVQLRCAHLQ